jgi:hypothetical protein
VSERAWMRVWAEVRDDEASVVMVWAVSAARWLNEEEFKISSMIIIELVLHVH